MPGLAIALGMGFGNGGHTPETIVVAPDANGFVSVTAANAALWKGNELSITTVGGNVAIRLLDETPAWFYCTIFKSNDGGGLLKITYYGASGDLIVPLGSLAEIADQDDEMTVTPGANRFWSIAGDIVWS